VDDREAPEREPDLPAVLRYGAFTRTLVGFGALVFVFVVIALIRSNRTEPSDPRSAVSMQMRSVVRTAAPSDGAYAQLKIDCAGDAPCFDLPVSHRVILEDAHGVRYALGPAIVTQDDIARAQAVLEGGTQRQPGAARWCIAVRLLQDGKMAFATATGVAVDAQPPANQLAIVLEGSVVSAPTVYEPITNGLFLICSDFDQAEAQNLADQLSPG
jgi:SecD-like export protein